MNDQHRLLDRDLSILSRAENYLSFQFGQVRPHIGRCVLEIGAGIGNHTQYLHALGPDCLVALERDPQFCEQLRRRFPDITVMQADADALFSVPWEGQRFDTIVMMNVLEHVADDGSCLRALRDLLLPGGNIIIVVPAFRALFSRLDRNYGHYRRYQKDAVSALADMAGLDPVLLQYFNLPGALGWLLFARFLSASSINPVHMRLFDAVVLAYARIESRFPALPFGLSLLAVLRRNP